MQGTPCCGSQRLTEALTTPQTKRLGFGAQIAAARKMATKYTVRNALSNFQLL
jgi:hypothetical protein